MEGSKDEAGFTKVVTPDTIRKNDYVLNGLALDWWALVSAEWVDTKKFEGVKVEDTAKRVRLYP